MKNRSAAKPAKPLTREDGEVREIKSGDRAAFRPAREVLLPEFFAGVRAERARRARGKQKAPVKAPVSIRLDADVVAHFREGGRGWQSRVNAILRKAARI
ncbi:MAG: BrnA antitoxin family protein [Alphaproteobacteria bacterium]|nr:BrnA antitoxin family protein [Alphaproteobacteria bacterium]